MMDSHELSRVIESEREWRTYMLTKIEGMSKKIDDIDRELSTFKVRVFALASVFGSGAGLSADYIMKILKGG